MDGIDIAQATDEMFRQIDLHNHYAGRSYLKARKSCPVAAPAPIAGRPPQSTLCRDCGEEIESARLDANPGADRCVDCQDNHERRARRGE